MRRCAACSVAGSTALDAALAAGQPQAAVARRFGLSKHVVHRHVANGHARSAGSVRSPVTAGPGASAEQQIRSIVESLDAVDLSALPTTAAMQVVRERRLAAEALAKLSGPEPSRIVALREVDGLPELMTVLFEELEPYPELRLRVAGRLDEIGWGAEGSPGGEVA